jgi:hypothetical protein
MNCPICASHMKPVWEEGRATWWNGLFHCKRCGDIKASGTWKIRGLTHKIEHWHPACPQCGHEHVALSTPGYQEFVCWKCYRRFEARHKHLIVTKRQVIDDLIHAGATFGLAIMGMEG